MDSELLMKKSSTKLVDINLYIEFLTEEGFEEPTSDPYNIISRSKSIIVARIRLIVDQESKKHGIYLSISQDVLINEIKNVPLFFRQKILKLREVNLPNPITVEAIQYGKCPDVPAELSEFHRIMFTGSNN